MLARADEYGDLGENNRSSGTLAGIGSTPIDNPFMSNWGPLASDTDQLYVPGVSNPKQGIFQAPRIQTPEKPAAPPAAKQVATQPVVGPSSSQAQAGYFPAYLRSIMTDGQRAKYGDNAFMVESRQ